MGFVRVDAKAPELVEVISRTSAHSNNHAALADVIHQSNLFGEPDWVVQSHLGYGKSNLYLGRTGCDGCSKSGRVNVGAATVKVVLSQPDNVVA